MNISDLKIGTYGKITSVGGEGALRQHFLDMGMIQGSVIKVVKYAPMGDPIEIKIHGYELTIRLDDAKKIEVEPYQFKQNSIKKQVFKETLHPGFGETGKYHDRSTEHPLADDVVLRYALVGNQNCGKTTLFNQLTGSNQHVGNFPGVTVDKKSGTIIGHPKTEVTDLPGIYSLSPYTSEEIVSRKFILDEKPHALINIVDATNIERNLYLTMQLMELDRPMVLALNMMDEMRKNGGSVRINEMEELLGIPVVAISAAKNEGIDDLVSHALHIAKYQEVHARKDFCDEKEYNGAIHRCLHGIMNLIEDHAKSANIPLRFAATKCVEGDETIIEALQFDQNEREMLEHIVCQMEEESGLDRASAIADMRYSFIEKLCHETVVKPIESKEHERSLKIDKFLTGKYTAIPSFIAIMGLVFYLTFNVIGVFFQNLLEMGIDWFIQEVTLWMNLNSINAIVKSLVVDGILSGVGSVISFVPIIVILFFFLSLLEDSGYMARVAFVMDKLLRKIGLSGRSIVPMLIGFGCTVPGVMASRTLPSARDRKLTILLTPFMSCSAKMPIYGYLAKLFFPDYAGLVMLAMYLIGIVMAIIVALLCKESFFKGEATPFVMELPNYRLPTLKSTLMLMSDKAKDFLQRAFTVIFVATIIIWFLQNFDMSLNLVLNSKDSILATISGMLVPIFKPLGFGDWRICTALITGFMAKESVVSTLSVLFTSSESILTLLTPVAAFSLLVFCLLYTPCVAAVASIRRELGNKWAVMVVLFQCGVAWVAAFLVMFIGSMIL